MTKKGMAEVTGLIAVVFGIGVGVGYYEQTVKDHKAKIFKREYSCEWYEAPRGKSCFDPSFFTAANTEKVKLVNRQTGKEDWTEVLTDAGQAAMEAKLSAEADKVTKSDPVVGVWIAGAAVVVFIPWALFLLWQVVLYMIRSAARAAREGAAEGSRGRTEG